MARCFNITLYNPSQDEDNLFLSCFFLVRNGGPFLSQSILGQGIIHMARYFNITWYNPSQDEDNLFLRGFFWSEMEDQCLSQKGDTIFLYFFFLALVPVYSQIKLLIVYCLSMCDVTHGQFECLYFLFLYSFYVLRSGGGGGGSWDRYFFNIFAQSFCSD